MMRLLSTVAPALAAEVAYSVFRRLGRRAPVRSADESTHQRARLDHFEINGKRVAVYAWGSGESIVLLVHGWRSRASHFGALIRALESADRTIVSFDAPGNGDSSGRRTTVLEYAEIISLLGDRYGEFEAIVGHSFGVLATFIAKREGVRAARIVSISGVYDFQHALDTFVRTVAVRRRAAAGLRRRIESRVFRRETDIWRRLVSELDPTDTQTPLLVVHDADDTAVDRRQAELIADAHTGRAEVIVTRGLGHSRILADSAVLRTVSEFVSGATVSTEGRH